MGTGWKKSEEPHLCESGVAASWAKNKGHRASNSISIQGIVLSLASNKDLNHGIPDLNIGIAIRNQALFERLDCYVVVFLPFGH